ncbi:MAG TPA: hypothetical protein PKC18_14845 [Lacipirellulaceae bacterium]|nr:hypothetical protein [Lacipirellulaceae bacterium]
MTNRGVEADRNGWDYGEYVVPHSQLAATCNQLDGMGWELVSHCPVQVQNTTTLLLNGKPNHSEVGFHCIFRRRVPPPAYPSVNGDGEIGE